MGRHAYVIDRGEHGDLTATRWVQPADELHRPLRVDGSVEADDDPTHIALPTSHHQDGALGAPNDPSRDAPHQETAHGTVTAPAEHDHVTTTQRPQGPSRSGGLRSGVIASWTVKIHCQPC